MEKNKYLYPFYVILHPSDGFEEMKWDRKKGSLAVSAVILLLLFITNVFSRQMTGFVFNYYRLDKLNIAFEFAKTVLPFLLWVIANWSLCTLMDGEGRFSEIWTFCSYALLPLILITIPLTVITNFMVHQEEAFAGLFKVIARGWTLMLMLAALKVVHQYTVKKTVISALLTVIGMGVIVFLSILVTSLFQQLLIFISTIYSEIMYRI